ncbi:MAG: hypothetical protein V5A76_05785 [Candidatus Thermoplasmatota archaeon]
MRLVFNILALVFIIGAIALFYQGGEFSLLVQVMVAIAIALAIVSGYFRLKY